MSLIYKHILFPADSMFSFVFLSYQIKQLIHARPSHLSSGILRKKHITRTQAIAIIWALHAQYCVSTMQLWSCCFFLNKIIQNMKSLQIKWLSTLPQSGTQRLKQTTAKTHCKASFLGQRTTTYPNDDAEMRHIIFKQGISSYHSHEVRCRGQESLWNGWLDYHAGAAPRL